jgi:ribonucleoside-diphosphate reductase alpha chain
MQIRKREGHLEELDIKKIQKMSIPSCQGLVGTNSSELEVDAHIKFIDGMNSADIQDALIKTAVDKTDIDRPNWTFVAARLFIYDLYHRVGKTTHGIKGKAYCHFKDYLAKGKSEGRLLPQLGNGFDLEDLNNYIKPERDFLFNYLGIKTLYDRYLIKDKKGQPIELPQQMFMAIAIFLAQKEKNKQTKAKEFYDVISNFEVMLATPTLSNARTNRHQLSSCYIGSTPDNIEGIFDMFKEFGILSKFGGKFCHAA